MTRESVYQSVTDRIVAALAEGVAPWRKPWIGGGPVNVRNGRPYRGINVFLLTLAGRSDGRWGTFKAMKEAAVSEAKRQGRKIEMRPGRRGEYAVEVLPDGTEQLFAGGVRKDEKATWVILWKPVTKREAEGEETDDVYMLLRSYAVFNAEQADGLPEQVKAFEHEPLEQAEKIVREYVPRGPLVEFGGGRACYDMVRDVVSCPQLAQFTSAEGYYSTLFHELVHATGHESRLDRLERTGFGTGPYAKEELVAEMGAAMLCGTAGIDNLDQSAAYVGNWLSALEGDPQFAIKAAALAQKAADLILDSQLSENPASE